MVPSGWMEITRTSALAEGGLTARRTGRAGAKAGQSDLTVPCGRAVTYRIKATPGITGLSCPRVHIDGKVWHLDIRGEMMETSFEVPAYNGELRRTRGRVRDNTVGSLTHNATSLTVMTP